MPESFSKLVQHSQFPALSALMLRNKYQPRFNYYFARPINELLYEGSTELDRLKDKAIYNEQEQYLRRLYLQKDFYERIDILAQGFQIDLLGGRPNLSPLPLFQHLLKRLRRHSKMASRIEKERYNSPVLLQFNCLDGIQDPTPSQSFVEQLNESLRQQNIQYSEQIHDVYAAPAPKFYKRRKQVVVDDNINQLVIDLDAVKKQLPRKPIAKDQKIARNLQKIKSFVELKVSTSRRKLKLDSLERVSSKQSRDSLYPQAETKVFLKGQLNQPSLLARQSMTSRESLLRECTKMRSRGSYLGLSKLQPTERKKTSGEQEIYFSQFQQPAQKKNPPKKKKEVVDGRRRQK